VTENSIRSVCSKSRSGTRPQDRKAASGSAEFPS